MPSHRTMEPVPVSSALGVEIRGVDLGSDLSEPAAAEIRAALGRHGVLFFRDQDLTPERHVAFDGWTEAESKPLLEFLYRHAARPEFTCRFNWRPGSIAFWDNRATWHYAVNDYAGQRRLMHRITLKGCRSTRRRWRHRLETIR